MTGRQPRTTTTIGVNEFTGDLLALVSSTRVSTNTRYGEICGGVVSNGAQVFLNVPYGRDVPRWCDPQPLPADFRYAAEPYIKDGLYCAQATPPLPFEIPARDRLGLGSPTENPFFADVYVPSSVSLSPTRPSVDLKPVKVFIHGGFLNFGSTSGAGHNQQFFAAEEFDEVRVLLGHRVSVLGFLASETHGVGGNLGFKDCWLGLEWITENISAFGGNPADVHLSGMSGGAHVVHQLLNYACHLSPIPAPFTSATLHSNAILTPTVAASSRENQFAAFARALGVDSNAPDALDQLRDTETHGTAALVSAVESLGHLSTFRGVAGHDGWNTADQVQRQRSGEMGTRLKDAGVQAVVIGDVKDEADFYTIAYPCQSSRDILPNLEAFYGPVTSRRLLEAYEPPLDPDSGVQAKKLQGRIMADGQVHLPVRLLARDLAKGGLPVVRYTVEYAAASALSVVPGAVSHGSDLVLHHFFLSKLTKSEAEVALALREALGDAVRLATQIDGAGVSRGEEEVLTLSKDGTVAWQQDWRWPLLRRAERAVVDQ